ncbi:MAG: transcription elongation factor GreA [Bacteroidales bacterium]|nr:transcription elongation factor GreA [Bacteroidales bacterium]MDD2203786.1 transcription elongation factor GreA [Bacteroidales bacterium]MDD3913275.1 transcription elongation factor GreA [Bacteroidales bacterium]MDD4633306.1 transcription elongation factor GreA [Bacteroidales bacterium]
MMSEVKYFTEDGLKKMKDELLHLITEERPAISRQIAEARDKGDLSENSEYDAAKEAQGLLELKIAQMQEIIRYAKIIDESKLDADKVLILSKVKVRNLSTNKEMEYTIVPENEANLREMKLSVASPIAKGLLGKTVGETAQIKVPVGILSLEILSITR